MHCSAGHCLNLLISVLFKLLILTLYDATYLDTKCSFTDMVCTVMLRKTWYYSPEICITLCNRTLHSQFILYGYCIMLIIWALYATVGNNLTLYIWTLYVAIHMRNICSILLSTVFTIHLSTVYTIPLCTIGTIYLVTSHIIYLGSVQIYIRTTCTIYKSTIWQNSSVHCIPFK